MRKRIKWITGGRVGGLGLGWGWAKRIKILKNKKNEENTASPAGGHWAVLPIKVGQRGS